MPVPNLLVAGVLGEITDRLELQGANPFRVRACRSAAREGRIHTHPGFDAKTEQHIAQALDAQRSKAVRSTLATAGEYETELVRHLEAAPGTGKVAVAGSFRRMRGTVGDRDILVTADDDAVVADRFVHHHGAAVHGLFTLDRARQTERILRALDHPSVTILAHPTGRLLGEREPYDVDLLQIVRKAKARGVCLEVNAQPDRLDLDDVGCRMCRDEGAIVAIGSNAHSTRDFGNLPFGVGQARRGWLERAHVLNAKPLAGLEAWLKRSRTGPAARSRVHRPARATAPG
jgi:hypothetical protein